MPRSRPARSPERSFRTAALWTFLQGWVGAAVQFATGIVMARLLAPADFGVFAAVTAYTALLLRQAQFGIPESLIRTRSPDGHALSAAFWWMEAFAGLAAAVAAGLAVALAPLYDDGRFVAVMLAVSATFFLMPFSATAGAWLRHQMRYREIARVSVILSLSGAAIGVAAAAAGAGVWSFVVAAWVNGTLGAWLYLRVSGWRPGRPRLRWVDIAPLVGYGWKMHLNNMLDLASRRVDRMLLGALAGSHALGVFNRAAQSGRMPVAEIAGRLYQAMFSALSRAQESGAAQAGMLNRKMLFALAGATYPALLLLWFAAEPFVVGLYGEPWREAVEPMRWIILGGFASVVSVGLGALSDTRGLAGRESLLQAVGLALAAAAVAVGLRWGLAGVAAAMAGRAWLMLGGLLTLVHRWSGCVRAADVVHAVAPPAVAAAVGYGAGAAWLGGGASGWTVQAAAGGVSVLCYGVALTALLLVWAGHPGRAVLRVAVGGLGRRAGAVARIAG